MNKKRYTEEDLRKAAAEATLETAKNAAKERKSVPALAWQQIFIMCLGRGDAPSIAKEAADYAYENAERMAQ